MGSSQKTNQYPYRNFYKKKPSRIFTYKEYPIIVNGKMDYVNEMVCPVCGTRGRYVLVEGDNCPMCYKCWMKCRHYKKMAVDTLGLQKQQWISLEETKRIVAYTKDVEVKEEAAYKTARNAGIMYAILSLIDYLAEAENRALIKKKFSSRKFFSTGTIVFYFVVLVYNIFDGYFMFKDIWVWALIVIILRCIVILVLPPKE